MSLILHINSLASSGCIAMIARYIVTESTRRRYDNVFAYGRGNAPDYCESIRIGSDIDFYEHALESRILDDQGKASRRSTRHFIEQLNELNPDVVHLHNIHGSYLNYRMLFDWLAASKVKVIWTLHDCWAFTGHCAYYDYVSCSKWKSGCKLCPRTSDYPKSWCIDRSEANYRDKKRAFTSVEPERMHLVTPSKWLANELGSSFLKACPVSVIPNGIDFVPSDSVVRSGDGKVRLLAVANKWHNVKGLADLRELSNYLDYDKYGLLIVGSISNQQKRGFAGETCFVGSVAGRRQMADLYAGSDVFLNLTHEDNFPTVNIEALRSGLPVISYGAGGSGEAMDDRTGYIVRDVLGIREVLDCLIPSDDLRALCVNRSMRYTANACADSYSTSMMRWLVSMEANQPKRNQGIIKQFWNYVFNASYQLLVIAAALVTTPYLARSLGPEALGIYGYVVSVASILQTLALLSLYTYGSRQVAYSRDSASEVNQVFWELMAIRCVLGVVTSAVYWGVALITPYTQLFSIYYPWILANILDVTWLFIGFEDMKVVVLKNVAVKTACVLCIFGFVRSENGLVAYVMIMSVFTFLGNVSVYPQLRRYVGKPDFGSGFTRRHLSNAVRLFIPEVTASLTHRINHITMGHVLDTADDIAFFDQGEKIINIPSSLVTAMNRVVMPHMANDHACKKENSVEDYVVAVGSAELMVTIPLAAGVASVAGRLVPWFFGPGFERAIPVIQIMSPLIVIDSLNGIIGAQYLTATDKTEILNWSNGLGLFVNIVLNVLLVPVAGCIGAVLSTVFARLTILAYQVLATINRLAYSRIAGSALRYTCSSLVMMAVVVLAGQVVENDVICTATQVLTGCVTYLVLLIVTRDPVLKTLFGVLVREKAAS